MCLILIICGVSLVTLSSSVIAQELDRNKEPHNFIVPEIVAGSIGAIVGITLGYALVPTLQTLLKIPACRSPFEGASDPRCSLPYRIGLTLGGMIGSSLLVVRTGSKFGVKGSLGLTFLGASIGSYAGLEIAAFVGMLAYQGLLADLIPSIAWPAVAILVVVISGLVPGTVTTVGFNIGATMQIKMMSVSPSGLELISARWDW